MTTFLQLFELKSSNFADFFIMERTGGLEQETREKGRYSVHFHKQLGNKQMA